MPQGEFAFGSRHAEAVHGKAAGRGCSYHDLGLIDRHGLKGQRVENCLGLVLGAADAWFHLLMYR